MLAQQAHRDHKAFRATLGRKAHRAYRATLDLLAHKAQLAHKAFRAI